MSKNSGISKTLTLWELLNDYNVVVPRIQRDYTQGRKDPKVEVIRERILTDIKNCLTSDVDSPEDGKTHSLAFVYGEKTVEKTNVTFLPIDGQQRLTTLWLVHWYVWFQAYQKGEGTEDFNTLANFSYETRDSSTDFCKNLCANSDDLKNIDDLKDEREEHPDEPLADLIRSRTWYLSVWQKDPTIDSMLRTLSGDAESRDSCIETIFKDLNFTESRDRLKEKDHDQSLPTFKLLILNPDEKTASDDAGIMIDSDDIYIKMNSRGKVLSDFENFKSDLVKAISENSKLPPNTKTDYIGLIDNNWTDIFWKEVTKQYGFQKTKTGEETETIDLAKLNFDPSFFSFINRFVLNNICLTRDSKGAYYPANIFEATSDVSDEKEDLKIQFEKIYGARLGNGNEADDSMITYEKFDTYYAAYLTPENLDWLKSVFKAFEEPKIQTSIKNTWRKIDTKYHFIPSVKYQELKHKTQVQRTVLRERVYFHATCRFFLYNNVNDADVVTKFERWMRVAHNLIRNCRIETISEMVGCLRDINDLADNIGSEDTYEYLRIKLSTLESEKSKNWYAAQLFEEAEKAAQILSLRADDFENLIEEAENSFFFNGSIRFLYRGSEGIPSWGGKYHIYKKEYDNIFKRKNDNYDNFRKKYDNAKEHFNKTKGTEDDITVATLKAFLSSFGSFDKMTDKYLFSNKGDDYREKCWKKDVLCREDLSNEINKFFTEDLFMETEVSKAIDRIKDKSLRLFISDETLLKALLKAAKVNWKFQVKRCGDLYHLCVVHTGQGRPPKENPYNHIYLGTERLQTCRQLWDLHKRDIIILNLVDRDKEMDGDTTCFHYNTSGYLRGRKIQFMRISDEKIFTLTVDEKTGKQQIKVGNEDDIKELSIDEEKGLMVGDKELLKV